MGTSVDICGYFWIKVDILKDSETFCDFVDTSGHFSRFSDIQGYSRTIRLLCN